MIVADFLFTLRQQGILFQVKEGQLLCDAPKGSITRELSHEITEHKSEIMQFLALTNEQAKTVRIKDQSYQHLFPIQGKGNELPLFMIAGAHNTDDEFMRYLSNLVPHFGISQPIYGLRPESIIREKKSATTVEAIAKHYVDEMIALNKDQPYLIIGECVGGILAFEVASQLLERGKQVPLLILMDTELPNFWYECQFHLENLSIKLKKIITFIKDVMTEKEKNLGQTISHLSPEKKQFKLGYYYRRILFRYRPAAFPGNLLMIRSEEEKDPESFLGWDNMCKQITLKTVPGSHITRLSQYSAILSRVISIAVTEAVEKDKMKNY